MFIPGGWWHGVLNLDNTVAITQNYSSEANFHRVWPQTRVDRPKLSCFWLKKLKKYHPEIHQRALDMN
jgi:histone arginine demethylase JMJD6